MFGAGGTDQGALWGAGATPSAPESGAVGADSGTSLNLPLGTSSPGASRGASSPPVEATTPAAPAMGAATANHVPITTPPATSPFSAPATGAPLPFQVPGTTPSILYPGMGAFAPTHMGTSPAARPAAATPPPDSKPKKSTGRPVGRPPLAGRTPGARRGRPPRQARPPGDVGAAAAVPSTQGGPDRAASWAPSLSPIQQQQVLSRAMHAARVQENGALMPFHALLQLGYVFVRRTQLPMDPHSGVGDGAVLRLDEAAALGVLPPQLSALVRPPAPPPTSTSGVPGASSAPAVAPSVASTLPARPPAAAARPEPPPNGWTVLSTPRPGMPMVYGGAPPQTSAAGQPVNPLNTRITPLPSVETTPRNAYPYKPLSPSETRALRDIMDKDARFAAVQARQQKSADSELVSRLSQSMAPTASLPWWVKSGLPDAAQTPTRHDPLRLIYPAQRQRQRELGLRGPRPHVPLDTASVRRVASLAESLVPIRLDLEYEPFKLRDTFTWNAVEDDAMLEAFAVAVCEDTGLPAKVFVELIKTAVQTQVNEYAAAMALSPAPTHVPPGTEASKDTTRGCLAADDQHVWAAWRESVGRRAVDKDGAQGQVETGTEAQAGFEPDPNDRSGDTTHDLRILIKLDILVGGSHLLDQFEWDIMSPDTLSAERFADAYTADLGLAGEFKTAVVHAIREQVSGHLRWLALLGYPYTQLAQMDEEVQAAFLPSLRATKRAHSDVDAFTPKLAQLTPIEVAHLEREHERVVRRKRRQTKGRRGAQYADLEPQRTIRSLPLWGFQGGLPDTTAAASAAPTSRRAAAAAAAHISSQYEIGGSGSVDENGAITAPTKRVRHDYYDMYFRYPAGLGSHVAPAAPRMGGAATLATVAAIQAEPRRAAREPRATPAPVRSVRPEDLERQQPNMHNGVWHCANCGMPGYLDAARRKGPAGEKTLCGPCGKYFHRHRRMETVPYTRDPAFHMRKLQHVPRTHDDDAFDARDEEAHPADDAPPVDDAADHPSVEGSAAAEPPSWLDNALTAVRTHYPDDRIEVRPRTRPESGEEEWRIRCFDCPGKMYKPGPGETLDNFEIHLRNRNHRTAVSRRLGETPEHS